MSAQIERETQVSPEVMNMFKMLGVKLPGSIKEISTPIETSTETAKIILPQGMDKLKASKELEKQYKNEEQLIEVLADFDGWNYKDVLVAIKRVTETTFGWMNAQNDFSFFGDGRPKEIDIVVDVKDGKTIIEKAFYGKFQMSYFDDAECFISVRNGNVSVKVEAKRKFSEDLSKYFNAVREHLGEKSIYRGKNIVVTGRVFEGELQIDFEIIENKGSDKIILNEKEELVVRDFILSSLSDPGKRCYLFTGGYGTGKTETAMRVGKTAVIDHNMSFFYVKDASIFDKVLNQTKKYSPALVFLEDVDEIASGEDRNSTMNSILNTLDGVQTKGNNLTVIFTTNHASRINSALRRPGRIDLVVSFENPDAITQKKIYQMYFNGISGETSLDYDKVIASTPSIQGAVIAEICKRAVKLATKRGGITTDIVVGSIASMEYQIQLMAEEPTLKVPEVEFFDNLSSSMSHRGNLYEKLIFHLELINL